MNESQPIHTSSEQKPTLNLGRQIVNFMGPEGSGKTTLAKRIAEVSGKPRLVYGHVFRELAKNDPGPWGEEAREGFREHRYIKPEILFEIIVDRIGQEDMADGFILDGAMRTVGEIELFQKMLNQAGRDMPFKNVFLRVPGWLGIKRIQDNIEERKKDRDDDTPEAILSRLSHFYDSLGRRSSTIRNTQNWELLIVNGIGTPDEVYKRVASRLTSSGK